MHITSIKNKKYALWSVPIVKTKKGDKLKPKKAKKILTPKKDFDHGWGFHCVYADNNYIAYTYSGENQEERYAEYDRKAKKHIAIDDHSNNNYVAIDEDSFNSRVWLNYAGTAGVILGIYHYNPKDWLDDGMAEGKGDYVEVLSCPVKSASKLVYEKKLNQFIKKKFIVHEVIKGRFLCSEPYTEEEGVEFADAIFYKKTGKGRILKKGEREWYYGTYNGEY